MNDGITIALLAALPTELAPTVRRLRLRRGRTGRNAPVGLFATGDHRGATVNAWLSGMGRQRVQQCVERMLAERRPNAVIHLGFAGGLSPTLRTGDVIEPYIFQHGEAQPQTPHLRVFGPGGEPNTTLLTVDQPALSATEKARLYEAFDCPDAVDMETHHASEPLRAAGIERIAIRAITDAYDDELPTEAMRWIDEHGRPQLRRITVDLLRQPALIHKMWKLRNAANRAGDALAECVERRLDEVIERMS